MVTKNVSKSPIMLQEENKASVRRYSVKTKAKKVYLTSTRKLHGVPLVEVDKSLDLNTFEFPFPILGCLCVQDSPDNPCPCTDLIVWILDRPVEVSKTGKRTPEGQEILDFTLQRDAEVTIELQVPIRLRELERIAGLAQRRRERARTGGAATTSAPSLGWLSLAASAGYAVGTLLDDLFGSGEGGNDNLSDDLSDWAAENFPAPGWLQDIF